MPQKEPNNLKPRILDPKECEARAQRIIEELEGESDRGCVLVGASVLSDFLEGLLRAALTTDSHAVKQAVAPLFGAMGPLATFSAKTKLAYALELIPRYCFNDLEKIRRIRNLAATSIRS